MGRWRILGSLIMAVLFAGCALFGPGENVELGDRLMAQGNWEEAAAAYQKALKEDPFNPTLQAKVGAAKGRAAAWYREQGAAALKERNFPLAIESFKRAVTLEPAKPEHQAALGEALRFKDAQDRLAIGQKLLKAGRLEDAAEALERALELDPGLKAAQEALVQLSEKQKAGLSSITGSRQPVTLKFQNARTKEVFEVLARTGGINFLFDKDMKDDPVTIYVKDAPFDDALNLLLTTQNLFMRRVAADTILIIPKTKQKLDQYQDLQIRTFYLSTAKAKDMVNLLRTMLETKRIFVNEDVNAIVMRDTVDKVRLAERIILTNDRKPGEVLFEIEVLEVDKTKNQTLGTNLVKQAGFGIVPQPPSLPTAPGFPQTSLGSTFTYRQLTTLGPAGYLFTLPASVLFNFFQSDASTKTLANPKIRVVNNKQAKINIGDKVPILLSNTNTNVPTGGAAATTTVNTITSIEYKDTGVKVTVEPLIHLNNDVTFKLQLEVTALGNLQPLGTNPPTSQFTFSTRSAETTLSLKDGESVVIGGLIQDQDRKTIEKVPGLGDIPVLGELFKATTNQITSTDVILTITPRIVRGLDVPGVDDQTFWSGTEETYATRQLYGDVGAALSRNQPQPAAAPVAVPAPAPSDGSLPRPTAPVTLSLRPVEGTVPAGQEAMLDVLVANIEDLAEGTLIVSYDPRLLEFRQALAGEFLGRGAAVTISAEANPTTGTAVIRLTRAEGAKGASGAGVLATLAFATKAPGQSSVVIQTPRLLTTGKAEVPVSGGHAMVTIQ